MTGNTDAAKCLKADAAFLGCKVDRAFTATQAITTFIGGVDTGGDPVLEDKKTRASLFAGGGAAGPGIVAASMLLLYKFGMAMFVGFGPLFILCLLFKQTSSMFSKWLMYGIGLMFANAALAVVASIAMDLTVNVAGALFATNMLGASSQGLMSLATQQLGLGLILSTLIISVPPMAANFFQGMLGSFNQNSAFTGWNAPMSGGAAGSGGSAFNGLPKDGGMVGWWLVGEQAAIGLQVIIQVVQLLIMAEWQDKHQVASHPTQSTPRSPQRWLSPIRQPAAPVSYRLRPWHHRHRLWVALSAVLSLRVAQLLLLRG